MARKAPCKTGSKFCRMEKKFAREGKKSPGGLAYTIGVKKYGASGMRAKSIAGRKRH